MNIFQTPRTKREAATRRRQVYAVLGIATAITMISMVADGPDERICHVTRLSNGATTPVDFSPRDAFKCSEFVEVK